MAKPETTGTAAGTALQGNLDRLRTLLGTRSGGIQHLIGGRSEPSADGATFPTESPVDGSLVATVARGGAVDIDRAAAAAAAAFGPWRDLSAPRRREILTAVAANIEAHADDIALLESWDTGQAQGRAARRRELPLLRRPRARRARRPVAAHRDAPELHVRQPIGPVGVITPWNTPFMLSTWKIAPALAAGCTVVHKPAEWSPLTARLLAEIMHEAGPAAGRAEPRARHRRDAGKALTEHPAIKAIAFVGESATGSAIMAQGAPTLKRVHFELGGKNPVIVFDDADLERALDAVVFMIYSLNGERCTSSSRLLVQRSIHDEFVAGRRAREAR
jgi:5-carboxymethyl-2-hydroxymuconic-semialdehyde dehydrogenase